MNGRQPLYARLNENEGRSSRKFVVSFRFLEPGLIEGWNEFSQQISLYDSLDYHRHKRRISCHLNHQNPQARDHQHLVQILDTKRPKISLTNQVPQSLS